jgi:hypothetical protein
MTSKRKTEIANEARRRANLWIKNVSFNEMTVDGSVMRFDMALGLFGFPFVPHPEWMNPSDFTYFVSEKEFNSAEYDTIICDLFDELYNRHQ